MNRFIKYNKWEIVGNVLDNNFTLLNNGEIVEENIYFNYKEIYRGYIIVLNTVIPSGLIDKAVNKVNNKYWGLI